MVKVELKFGDLSAEEQAVVNAGFARHSIWARPPSTSGAYAGWRAGTTVRWPEP
jgi:hypothetical protein